MANTVLTMDLAEFLRELLIVVVLYQKKSGDSRTCQSLRAAFPESPTLPAIFIYDNSPVPFEVRDLPGHYVHDPANSGVSVAYNRAASHAEELQKKWMLQLDQDTDISGSFFVRLQEATVHYPDSIAFVPMVWDNRGLISPFAFAFGRGFRISKVGQKLSLDRFRFINSGLLIRVSAFSAAGGYDPSIPLDFSDISFAERLKKVSDHFIAVNATLQQDFSGTRSVDRNDALSRYRYFCKGAAVMGRTVGHPNWYGVQSFLRGLRLSVRYADLRFMTQYFKYLFNG